MELEEIQRICHSFPAVTEDIKWEHHLCFNVGGKMFLITSPDEYPVTASFKVSDEDFEALSEREGFIPAPYLARNKWVKVDNIKRLSAKQWKHYLESSYRIIASKLSAKERRRLGID
jgi:predicted DNA-binding protein (MmcQ/YjbR family)